MTSPGELLRPLTLWTVLLAAVALLLPLGAGCAGQRLPVEAGPMPPGVQYTGKWYSPQYENMELVQKGETVTGTFSYKAGGTLEGQLDGNLLLFSWIQPGDMSEARQEIQGSGYFVISPDGEKLSGEWGYGEARTGGGVWNAERISQKLAPAVDPEEPVFNQ